MAARSASVGNTKPFSIFQNLPASSCASASTCSCVLSEAVRSNRYCRRMAARRASLITTAEMFAYRKHFVNTFFSEVQIYTNR